MFKSFIPKLYYVEDFIFYNFDFHSNITDLQTAAI